MSTVTEADRKAAADWLRAQVTENDVTTRAYLIRVRMGDSDQSSLVQAFAAHREAAIAGANRGRTFMANYQDGLIEGARRGLEAAAKVAERWRDENKASAAKQRRRSSYDTVLADQLDGAAIECNAIMGAIRELDPATIIAVDRKGGMDG